MITVAIIVCVLTVISISFSMWSVRESDRLAEDLLEGEDGEDE